MSKLFDRFKKTLAAILALVALLAAIGPATFAPIDAQNLKLNFAVIADTHIAPLSENARGIILAKGLRDMAKAQVKSDALVIAGDLTEAGLVFEYDKLENALKTFSKAENLVLEMGNHDIRGIKTFGEYRQSYEFAAAKYHSFLAGAAGVEEETIYFHKIIKDCYFIALNTEEVRALETHLSPTQLGWLDTLLAQAVASGNPIFIINHQPMESIGEDAPALMDVLQEYNGAADIFFITGHKHRGFSANTIKSDGTLHFVDLPSYGKKPGGEYNKTGSGYQVELYEERIVFRARNFSRGEWLSEYDWTIGLASRTSG